MTVVQKSDLTITQSLNSSTIIPPKDSSSKKQRIRCQLSDTSIEMNASWKHHLVEEITMIQTELNEATDYVYLPGSSSLESLESLLSESEELLLLALRRLAGMAAEALALADDELVVTGSSV